MSDAESRWRRVTEWVIAREGVLPEDARDLAQDIAIGYAERRGIEPWNDPLPQGALLRCLIHHAIASYHRSKARERDGVQRLCANLVNTAQQSVEQMAVEHLIFNELQSQMSPFMRETADLMLEGYTFHEIAEQFGMPEGTVKARFYREAAQLRKKAGETCNQKPRCDDFNNGESASQHERGNAGGSSLHRRRRRRSRGGGRLAPAGQYPAAAADVAN